MSVDEQEELQKRIESKARQEREKKNKTKKKRKQESSRSTSPIELDNLDIQPDTPPETPNMPRGNRGGDDDDDRYHYWSLRDIPKFEGKGEQPFSHLMEFEDYLIASGVRVESEEVGGNTVHPDYKDIINKFKASLKTMQESGLVSTLRKEWLIYTQQMDGKQ